MFQRDVTRIIGTTVLYGEPPKEAPRKCKVALAQTRGPLPDCQRRKRSPRVQARRFSSAAARNERPSYLNLPARSRSWLSRLSGSAYSACTSTSDCTPQTVRPTDLLKPGGAGARCYAGANYAPWPVESGGGNCLRTILHILCYSFYCSFYSCLSIL